ncbi:hypothetical protein LOK49_LG07G00396 [Camellia lanceoleosa]|uniref:Uncharacterized protein n=1 Tax=Camellia lanceoleosa TaxID=1840588 RepID=A0ACC0H238_9ERIC|nr:hypothetical protein LOK49_LG07G00396 [Camellia lanceoleosa]
MSRVNLSAAHNLHKVLSMLPSLLELCLPYCGLDNCHLSHMYVNSTVSNAQYLDKYEINDYYQVHNIYDLLHKLGIPQPIQYLQSRYPEGIPLVTIFVHPSMIEMLDSATEDAIERGSCLIKQFS